MVERCCRLEGAWPGRQNSGNQRNLPYISECVYMYIYKYVYLYIHIYIYFTSILKLRQHLFFFLLFLLLHLPLAPPPRPHLIRATGGGRGSGRSFWWSDVWSQRLPEWQGGRSGWCHRGWQADRWGGGVAVDWCGLHAFLLQAAVGGVRSQLQPMERVSPSSHPRLDLWRHTKKNAGVCEFEWRLRMLQTAAETCRNWWKQTAVMDVKAWSVNSWSYWRQNFDCSSTAQRRKHWWIKVSQ